ncbi:hypothetical protein CCMSSC00406_0007654 [Pleurotus cornucopiae]|uniref:Uncharacterized protein n=1 Tax=Pleurotus cornucopiae TaxID=5321 RepID=A0ACB7J3F5_PLECO|nr:hypothetical protein CCMSSC00406_0007654 [Pleurotus cornucopiae]
MSVIVSIARYIVLSLSLIFAVAVLGLSARTTDTSILFLGGIAPFEIINLVVAPLTIVALSIILSVGAFRQNAITSMIWVEVTTLSIIWAMWVVVAVFATRVINFNFPLGCSAYIPFYLQLCSQITAIQGLAWTVFVLLMGYSVILGIMACVATSRGIPVWSKSVKDATFSHPSLNQGVQMPPKPELQANHQHAHLQLPQQANYQQPSLQASALQNNGVGYSVPMSPDGTALATTTPNQTPAYPQV